MPRASWYPTGGVREGLALQLLDMRWFAGDGERLHCHHWSRGSPAGGTRRRCGGRRRVSSLQGDRAARSGQVAAAVRRRPGCSIGRALDVTNRRSRRRSCSRRIDRLHARGAGVAGRDCQACRGPAPMSNRSRPSAVLVPTSSSGPRSCWRCRTSRSSLSAQAANHRAFKGGRDVALSIQCPSGEDDLEKRFVRAFGRQVIVRPEPREHLQQTP